MSYLQPISGASCCHRPALRHAIVGLSTLVIGLACRTPSALGQCEVPADTRIVAPSAPDYFGYSVAVSGSVAVIGAHGEPCPAGDQCGAAYVYRFNGSGGSGWVQEARLTASDGAEDDAFGVAVAAYGDVIVVGAPWYNCASGAQCGVAYVYRFDGSAWTQEQKLTAPALGHFGRSASISGDALIVGASEDDCGAAGFGSAYVYRFSGGSWAMEQKLCAAQAFAAAQYGISVSMSDDVAIVGAMTPAVCPPGTECGWAYVYRFNGGAWSLEQTLASMEENRFGASVAASQGKVIVGAPYETCGELPAERRMCTGLTALIGLRNKSSSPPTPQATIFSGGPYPSRGTERSWGPTSPTARPRTAAAPPMRTGSTGRAGSNEKK